MNIFVLDTDPQKAAEYHCDKHVVKMILETAQLLCTAIRYYGISNDKLYKSTHLKHPCTQWVIESRSNAEWLLELGFALCAEYTLRYNKVHKTLDILTEIADNQLLFCIPNVGPRPFVLAMPDKYKDHGSVVDSYRAYYIGEKKSFAKWKIKTPDWWNNI